MSGFKVLALKADSSGCGRYRIVEPARAVNYTHPEIHIQIDTGVTVQAYKDHKTLMTTVEYIDTDADLIIVQRPLAQWFTSMIEQARRQGIPVVVELDDDFENVHRKNAVWENVQPSNHPESNYEWLKRACDLADWVTVSTPGLARYAPHGRVSVVPNYIPEGDVVSDDDIVRSTAATRIGWSGIVSTHPTDLQVVGSSVNQVLRDTGSQLSVVGDAAGIREALSVAKSLPFEATGWIPLENYMTTLNTRIDVGIVPLDDTEFNRCKSNLKGLEYAARAIPFVASPLPEYQSLAASGIGELASSPSEWRAGLTRLVQSADLRAATGDAYRALVRERWILEDHADEWVAAWRNALNQSVSSR